MADNTTLNPGADGDIIATDDIGGVKHQYVKVEYGAADSATPVSPTNPLPVEISDGTDTALVDGSGNLQVNVTANTGLATSANQLPDGHAVTVDNGAGASAVNIQDGGNTITVDGTVAVTGVATAANQLPDGHNVTIDNSTGASAVNIQDGGNSITVDGTVAVTGVATAANQLPDGHNVTIDNASGASAVNIQDGGNSITVDAPVGTPVNVQISDGTDTALVSASGQLVVTDGGTPLNVEVIGDVAHDAAAGSNPVLSGGKAIAHGTNPTEVAANDASWGYHSLAGIPFVMGGHPNVVTEVAIVTDANGAQTNTSIADTTEKIVVTRVSIACDNANTADVGVLVGFAATSLGSPATTGTTGLLVQHPGIPAGGGITVGDGSGILGVGATGEDLRYSCDDPVGGNVSISVSYYTISG